MNWLLRRNGKQQAAGASMFGASAPAMAARPAWILMLEHAALRVVSLLFSLASAYAISQVFAPYNGDVMRMVADVFISGGFGVLGYFISRSIAYRLFFNQPVWAYLPICLVVEFVEIFCNYVMGAGEVPHQPWLLSLPVDQRPMVTGLAYIVLAIIPAVTLFLAVLDMDLERRKLMPQAQPKQPQGRAAAAAATGWNAPTSQTQAGYPQQQPPTQSGRAPYQGGYQGSQGTQAARGAPLAQRPGVQQAGQQGPQGGSSNGATPLAGAGVP